MAGEKVLEAGLKKVADLLADLGLIYLEDFIRQVIKGLIHEPVQTGGPALFEEDFHDSQSCPPQAEGVDRARRRLVDGEHAGNGVHLVGQGDQSANSPGWGGGLG